MVKGSWIALGVLAAIALVVVGVAASAIGTYNEFVKETEGVDAQSKQVDVQYQLAFSLLPTLERLTATYMQNEADVMQNVSALRSGLAPAQNGTLTQKDDFLGEYVQFVALVGNRVENYPNLKSDALFQRTMDEFTNVYNKIAMEKVRYNDRVEDYNAHRRQCCLPAFIANTFGFDAKEYIGHQGRPNQTPFPEGAQL